MKTLEQRIEALEAMAGIVQAEPKTKSRYDWPKAPKEARYWTTDFNGRQDWWVEKPIYKNGCWIPLTYDYLPIAKKAWTPCPDAADSLEVRPM